MIGTLPDFLEFRSAVDLVRVGRDNDGGYLVSAADIARSEVLIAGGMLDDWSFEEDFLSHREVPVTVYDASVGLIVLLTRCLRSVLFEAERGFLAYRLGRPLAYLRFFRDRRKHVRKFIGPEPGANFVTLDAILGMAGSGEAFLKLDIEGGEYAILNDVLRNQERLSGMVIEFHDCNARLGQIRDFVGEFSLRLVHVHANNHVPMPRVPGLPDVMEMTFSRNATPGAETLLPHPLDMPNFSDREDILLRFEGGGG